MKRLLFAFLLCGVFESCFCQDVKGFIMKQYEEWFSSKDSILSSGYYETDYLIKDLTLNKSKQEFFESIQSIDAVLDYPSQATVQINLDNGILFIETLFNINNCESDEDCCQCEDTTIDELLRHLNNRDEGIKWHYKLGRIFDSDGQSIDYDQDEFYNHYKIDPAAIQDRDGYVNDHADRSGKSSVVDTIKEWEVIFYTRSIKSDWWRVYRDHGNKFLGYVHKSRILTYENCPPEVQREIEREMH